MGHILKLFAAVAPIPPSFSLPFLVSLFPLLGLHNHKWGTPSEGTNSARIPIADCIHGPCHVPTHLLPTLHSSFLSATPRFAIGIRECENRAELEIVERMPTESEPSGLLLVLPLRCFF